MKLGEVQVTGVAHRVKDGKSSFTLYGLTPFEDWENGIGLKSIVEWTNRVDLSEVKPGDIVLPVFARGFQGKAILSNVTVIRHGTSSPQ